MAKNIETTDTGVASNDAYTGMLAISLIALIAGCFLLFLDYSQYSGTPPKANLPAVQKVAPVVPPVIQEKKDDEKKAPEEKKDEEKKDEEKK